MSDRSRQHEGELLEERDQSVEEPDMYRVVLHNDHYTTMDFVVEVLVRVFHKSLVEANAIMLSVHQNGTGEAGVYTYDIAATKVQEVKKMAREREFPLKCTMEKQ